MLQHRVLRASLAAALALVFSCALPPCYTAPTYAAAPPRLVILCVDNLRLVDVNPEDLPALFKFAHSTAWGLMNTNVAGPPSLESAYLTLGAGTRSRAADNQPGLMVGETSPEEPGSAAEIFARRSGRAVEHGVVQLGIGILRAVNADLGYDVNLGALGQALRAAGHRVAIIGNADTNSRQRPLVNFLMDAWGHVPYGYTGTALFKRDPSGPFGAWLDTEAVIRETRKVWPDADLVAVEWSDLHRAEQYAPLALPEAGASLRRQALARLDGFLDRFLPAVLDAKVPVLLLVPAPGPQEWAQGQRLTPIALLRPDAPAGLLTSATTRRLGLAANIDVAATVLTFFDLTPSPAVLGRPLRAVPAGDSLAYLSALEERAVGNFQQRPLILRIYIGYLIVTLALTLLAFWRRTPLGTRWLELFILGGATVPLTFLLLAALPPSPPALTLAATAVLTALLVAVWRRASASAAAALMLSAACTLLVLVGDLLGGQNLVAASLLGYCFISGARYYGLGNEYMGVFLGAALSLAAYLCDRFDVGARGAGRLLVVLLLIGAWLLAASQLGSNAGGTLAWVSGAAAAYLGLNRRQLRAPAVAGAVLTGVAILGLFAFADWRLAATTSHMGQALEAATRSGTQSLGAIIVRKLAMNLKLLRYSLWSRVLLMLLLVLASLFLGPYRLQPRLMKERPLLAACLRGSLIGSLVALVANDSGVVAAATSLLFPVMLLILLTLPERLQENQRKQQELALRRN